MGIETFRIQIVAVLGALVFLGLVVQLIRTNKLKVQYSLLWFVATAVILLFAVWRSLLDRLAHFFGVDYAPSFLFLVSLFFIVLLIVHFSIINSRHSRTITRLTQEIAMIREELRAATRPNSDGGDGDSDAGARE